MRPGAALFSVIVLAAALAPLPAVAQQATFASRLRAELVEHQVKLTWKDSPDATGIYLIYRSTAEITAENLGAAQLIGKAASGTEFFLDSPPDSKPYFYAVLLQDDAGKLHSTLIPFRNRTDSAVSVQIAASEQELAARVTGIRAAPSASGDAIQVSFQSSNPSRELLFFWGTSPLSTAEDLVRFGSATQLDAGATRYVLPVLPGVTYWFAVVDSGLYKLGKTPLEKGVNATVNPVEIPVGNGRSALAPVPAQRRALPLPSLSITFGVQTGQSLGGQDPLDAPEEKAVSPATEKAISALLEGTRASGPEQMKQQVLPEDATPMPGGELAQLQTVVAGPFSAGDLADARTQLLNFLSLRRSAEIEAHARFYLGQILYLQDNPRDALLEFLVSQDFYYQATQPWEDACFRKLEAMDR